MRGWWEDCSRSAARGKTLKRKTEEKAACRECGNTGAYKPKKKWQRVVETFFNRGLHGLKRITRKIRPQSIYSLAHPNGVFQIIHNSFLIRAFRAIRGFYFPS